MTVVRLHTVRGLATMLLTLVASTAAAQSAGPYVSGHVGISGGDVGGVATAGGTVGYMTTRRLGFELELGATPSLDLGDPAPPSTFPTSRLYPFPSPTVNISGHMLTFQTNAVAALTSGGKLHVFVIGGGGVANLHQDVLYRYADIVIPTLDPNNPVLVFPPLPSNFVDRRLTRSENALCLNIGGIVDYGLTSRIAIGVDARYTQAFFNPDALKTARVAARIRWHF